jgi:hypothetical protein
MNDEAFQALWQAKYVTKIGYSAQVLAGISNAQIEAVVKTMSESGIDFYGWHARYVAREILFSAYNAGLSSVPTND